MASAATQSAFNMAAAFNQCVDPDIDSWVDFGTMPSPTPTSSASRLPVSSASSATTSPATTLLPLDQAEDHQTPAKPSHEYERWKQQTGLPSNSVPGLQSNSSFGPFSNSGLSFDDMSVMGESNLDGGWNSGLSVGADVNMELDLTSPGTSLPAYFFPTGENSRSDDFVNPSAIQQEESRPNVRVWPGMHQQQAALVKAQQQAAQQRQQQIIQRQQQQQQQKKAAEQHGRMHHSRRSASNQITDARTEETIARVVNQIRQSSQLSNSDSVSPPGSVLPQIVKMKKDEEEMDEDERLLASEEGKKLSSKERRQLRNKVSARAFRSRRKEYISQLEGEVAMKSNECNELRSQTRALMDENMRYRNFTEKLLRHPAFQPFLEDLSRDPALTDQLAPSMQAQLPSVPSQNASVTAVSQEAKPAFSMAQQQVQNPRIGMALVPETQVDLSSLNLDNNWAMPNMGFNFQQPQVYAVLELPEGPANPIDPEFLSGKAGSYEEEMSSPAEEEKADYPVIERPAVQEAQAPAVEEPSEEELNDPDFALYINAPAPSATAAAPADSQPLFGDIAPEKVFAHFELFVSGDVDESESQRLMEQFERTCARIEPVFQRLQDMTSFLDL